MNLKVAFACALLLTLATLGVPASSRQAAPRPAPPARSDAFETSVKPFLQSYCYSCHSGRQPAAAFDLTSYGTADSVRLTVNGVPVGPPVSLTGHVYTWSVTLAPGENTVEVTGTSGGKALSDSVRWNLTGLR